MRWLVILAAVACEQHVAAPVEQPAPPQGSAWQPRCIAAGGKCVGPATIEANPSAPCAAGFHRVDDVAAPAGKDPACLGIPYGEEACCMPDR